MTSTHNSPDPEVLRDLVAVEHDEARLARDTARLEHDLEAVRTVDVTVNNKPVRLSGGHDTGTEIKRAAIAQGVPNIGLDFQLFEEVADGDDVPVADDTRVRVRPGTRFSAIAPDDNS